jgi:hypothetical protein
MNSSGRGEESGADVCQHGCPLPRMPKQFYDGQFFVMDQTTSMMSSSGSSYINKYEDRFLTDEFRHKTKFMTDTAS